jgi:O-methyltransferase
MKRVLYEAAAPVAFPALAPWYCRNPALFAPWMLEAVGIADPTQHPAFRTLARIIGSIEQFAEPIAECGVWKGNTLFGIANLLRLRGVSVAILGFDSFEGLPEPTAEDSVYGVYQPETQKGVFNDTSYEGVLSRARRLGFRDIQLVKGHFENTLEAFADRNFTLVHLDVDLYHSYLTCLEFFYPRMVPGGFIVFDEYESTTTYPGAAKAINEFLSDKSEAVQRFPDLGNTVRSFIVKARP